MVEIYVASYNTRDLTRRCVDSILAKTHGDFRLTVGDSASNDGSLALLEEFAARGAITLQVERERRDHAWWLDRWTAESKADYAVFVDSDIVIRSKRWLPRLVRTAEKSGAAIVAAEFCREGRNFVEPVGQRTVRLSERPAPWLMLVRPAALRTLETSFAFTKIEPAQVPEGIVVYDVGAWLFDRAKDAGLTWRLMPPLYRRFAYAHRAGGSWR